MIGIVESALIRKFGNAIETSTSNFRIATWNVDDDQARCVIYKPLNAGTHPAFTFPRLYSIYGDSIGGSILGDSIVVAMLSGPEVFGVWRFEDLQQQPEIIAALAKNPRICYFMECANVWFYGVHDSDLYVYDAATEELDRLGPVQRELDVLIQQWQDAQP